MTGRAIDFFVTSPQRADELEADGFEQVATSTWNAGLGTSVLCAREVFALRGSPEVFGARADDGQSVLNALGEGAGVDRPLHGIGRSAGEGVTAGRDPRLQSVPQDPGPGGRTEVTGRARASGEGYGDAVSTTARGPGVVPVRVVAAPPVLTEEERREYGAGWFLNGGE